MKKILIRSALLSAASFALASSALAGGGCGGHGEPACPADDASVVLNTQLQLGDVWGEMNVHVAEPADGVAGTSAAYGNASSGMVKSGDIDYDAVQANSGTTGARTVITTGDVRGAVVGTTVSYGNSSTSGSWNGSVYNRAEQSMSGTVNATSDVQVRNVHDLSVGTTAAANIQATEGEYGTIANFADQRVSGSVNATSDVQACCTGNSSVTATTALGNSSQSSGYAATSYNGAVQIIDDSANVGATTNYYAPQAYGTTVAASTASGNSAVVHNAYGYATLGRPGSELYQEQAGRVDAQTYVTLDEFGGLASASAYGVGNSALISNVGSDTDLYANQYNTGTVTATTGFYGSSSYGGVATTNTTAIGNAASAYLCDTCGDAALRGNVNQVNSGNVYATGTIVTPGNGTVIGSTTAVGNSATFQSSQPDH